MTHRINTRFCLKVLVALVAAAFILPELKAEELPPGFDKNSVQFIFSKSGTNYYPSGTSFAITVPVSFNLSWWKHFAPAAFPFYPRTPLGINYAYFVTAKHVLLDGNDNVRPNLYWRLAQSEGGVTYTPLDLSPSSGMRILTHPDKSVDIAVFTIATNKTGDLATEWKHPGTFTVAGGGHSRSGAIRSAVLKDKKFFDTHPIREGDDMFFVGLFTPFYGDGKNIPISRFGRISMVSDEKIPFLSTYGTNLLQDLYVTETSVFGGNSGSPAFFFRKGSDWYRHFGHHYELERDVYFAGVVKGYFNDWSEVKMVNTQVTPISQSSFGVSVITPGYHLYEILYSDEEKAVRVGVEKTFREMK